MVFAGAAGTERGRNERAGGRSEMLTTVLVASVLAVSAQTDYYPDMDQDDLENNGTGKTV